MRYRINFRIFKFRCTRTRYSTNACAYNKPVHWSRPFNHRVRRSYLHSIEDGIFLGGNDGERIPRLSRHLDCRCWTRLLSSRVLPVGLCRRSKVASDLNIEQTTPLPQTTSWISTTNTQWPWYNILVIKFMCVLRIWLGFVHYLVWSESVTVAYIQYMYSITSSTHVHVHVS